MVTRDQRREVLNELRAEVDDHLHPGMPAMQCRVCDQTVFLGKHKIDSSMAKALIRLYGWEQDHPGEPMDYRNRNARGESRKHSLLRHWDLAVRSDRRTGPKAGFWMITELGQRFVEDRVRVPAAAWLYNSTCYGLTKRKTSIYRAYGDHFNLPELLASLYEPSTRKK